MSEIVGTSENGAASTSEGDAALPRVSVIIPTYHDWPKLEANLQALMKQSYPQDRFEVVVVNNAPDDHCPFELPGPNVRVIAEARPGSYAARNTGIGVATGEIFAFTDADCLPSPQWLEAAVTALRAGADRVAGRVELTFQSDQLTLAELYEQTFAFDQEKNIKSTGACVTANLVAWRRVFDGAGFFDATMLSGGDMEWGRRAASKGFNIVFVPEAVVRHAARTTLQELLKKSRRVAAGVARLEVLTGYKKSFLRRISPPISVLPRIKGMNNLSDFEKAQLFGLVYLMKVHRYYHQVLVRSGFSKSRRA